MSKRFKWLIPILILVVVLVPLLGSIACEPEALLYYLVRSFLCGIEIFVDGGYEGITEQLTGFMGCVFLGTITQGVHTLEFKAPSSVVAAASAPATEKAIPASEVPDIRVTYNGPVVDGGRYEVKLSQSTKLGGAASIQNQEPTYEGTITVEISSEPFEPEPPVPPPAEFQADKTVVEVGETVTFTNLTTGGTPPYTKAEWDFDGGDGVFEITLAGNHAEVMADVIWAYDAPGVYSVILQMTDSTPITRWEERPNYITVTDEVEDILAYYRALTDDPLVADLADVVAAANDYLDGVIPPGFTTPITLPELVELANEWLGL